ncbi:MAG: V-type ATP synthase subunit D [Candidatus Omnitrophica bacterium]|nr:V-type ATP synthase subunit D [Candidatus Omnitrophota bacterium]
MAKLKLTKNELKKQKEALKMFVRYLPTLQLKKQQLQTEIGKINRTIRELDQQQETFLRGLEQWVDVFAEDIGIENWFKINRIVTDTGNIAGIDIPVYVTVEFDEQEYDLMRTPLWVDAGIGACKEYIQLKAKQLIAQKQQEILQEELRITSQRVNLFEKVKIPHTKEHIRVIRIALGDLQTAEVVRGKIAKKKLLKKQLIAA